MPGAIFVLKSDDELIEMRQQGYPEMTRARSSPEARGMIAQHA